MYEDLTDEEVMTLLAETTGRKQNSIIRDIERRTEKALKAVTRDYVDPEAARNAAVYEVTTPQGIERFLASEKKNLSAWTATIAAKRIGQDAGLVGEGMRTDAAYKAGSWDQRLEERGDAAYDGAEIPTPQSDEGLHTAVIRMGFERITGPQPDGSEPLTEKQRAAILRYANLHKDNAPAGMARRSEAADSLRLSESAIAAVLANDPAVQITAGMDESEKRRREERKNAERAFNYLLARARQRVAADPALRIQIEDLCGIETENNALTRAFAEAVAA